MRLSLRTGVLALTMLAATRSAAYSDPLVIEVPRATGNCTRDTRNAQNALSSVPASGAVVYFPRGAYCLQAPLALPNAPVHVRGAGMEVTILKWTVSSDGLVGNFTSWYVTMPTTISELSLATTVNSTGAAISLNFPDEASSINEPTARIFNVSIRPEESTTPGIAWEAAIRLDDAWNAHLSDIFIHGDNNDRNRMTYGIHILNKSMDVAMSRIKISGAAYGIFIGGTAEGPLVDTCTIFGVGTGVHSSTIELRPWLTVTNRHIAAFDRGIFLENRAQATISGNLIYRDRNGTAGFVGIYLSGSGDARLSSNQVYVLGPATGTSYGVVAASSYGTIVGNVFADATYGVWLPPGSTGWTIIGNVRRGGSQTVVDQGASNVVQANNPM